MRVSLVLTVAAIAMTSCGAPDRTLLARQDGGVNLDTGADLDTEGTCDAGAAECNGLVPRTCDENGLWQDGAECPHACVAGRCECQLLYVGDGFACNVAWVLNGSVPDITLVPDNYGWKAAAIGTRIYFGPDAGTESSAYFVNYDVVSRAVSAPLAMPTWPNDFLAGGYTDAFVGNGAAIFMLGNQGSRYDPGADTWTEIAGYVDPNRRGEAAGTWDDQTGALLLIGGRGPLDTALRFEPASGTFSLEPGTLPQATSSAMAYTIPGAGDTYLAGGDTTKRLFARHRTGSADWSVLADLPVDVGRPTGMGHFGARVFVSTAAGRMYLYNPASDAWDRELAMPQGASGKSLMVDGSAYAMVQAEGGAEVYELVAVE